MPTTIPSITGSVVERHPGGRITVGVKSGQTVVGGNLVEITAAFEVQKAGADSLKVLGVATHDADPAGEVKKVTVAMSGVWDLTASGSVTAGDYVKAGAAGVAVAIAADVDPRLAVGIALETVTTGNPFACLISRCGVI